jgi:tryptophan-rich sensory protein
VNPTLLALVICIVAPVLEGVLAGGNARQRLGELRMPPYSPPLALWLVIGLLFYEMCFVIVRHLLGGSESRVVERFPLALLLLVLVLNAHWNLLFFRWRNLRASFLTFLPYGVLVAVLLALLARVYPLGAILLGSYCLYLIYAVHWGYRLWRLNSPGHLT